MIGITKINVILGKKQVFRDIKGLVHVEIYYKPTLICIDFISWLLKIPYDYFSRPCFIHTHFDIIHIRQRQVSGEKHLRRRVSRESLEYFSHTNKSWFTVCEMRSQSSHEIEKKMLYSVNVDLQYI